MMPPAPPEGPGRRKGWHPGDSFVDSSSVEEPSNVQAIYEAGRLSVTGATDKGWRDTKLTIGIAAAILLSAAALVGFILRWQDSSRATAAEVVTAHAQADVDRAHSDLPNRYTSIIKHVELVSRLVAIESALYQMQSTLKEIAANQKKGK